MFCTWQFFIHFQLFTPNCTLNMSRRELSRNHACRRENCTLLALGQSLFRMFKNKLRRFFLFWSWVPISIRKMCEWSVPPQVNCFFSFFESPYIYTQKSTTYLRNHNNKSKNKFHTHSHHSDRYLVIRLSGEFCKKEREKAKNINIANTRLSALGMFWKELKFFGGRRYIIFIK